MVNKFVLGYIVAFLLLIAAFALLTPSLTGNAVANVSEKNSGLLSIILFVAGLGTFLFVKIKK